MEGIGQWPESGIIDIDPLFTNPENDDYSLQESSPCIDAGTTYFEMFGDIIIDIDVSEYYGLAPDMGAFEWIPETQLGDLNADGVLDVIDIVAMVNLILEFTYDSLADMNADNIVDILDIMLLLNIVLDN